MSVRPMLRRIVGVAALTTVGLASTPFAGVATALANPVVSPANGAVAGKRPTVSAAYGAALDKSLSSISVKGATQPANASVAGTTSYSADAKTISFLPAANLTEADNPYTVSVTAVPASPADLPADTETWSFSIDATPPALPATLSLAPERAVSTVEVRGTTSPNTQVAVSVANVTGTAAPATGSGVSDGTGAFTVSGISVTGLADGAIRATVTATDAVGNSASSTVDGLKDATAPARVTTLPADGTYVKPRTTVVVTYDEALKPAGSSITLKNGVWSTLLGSTTFSDADRTMTFTSASQLTERGGLFTVIANATDLAGNAVTTTTTFRIDDTKPAKPTSVTLTDPINRANRAAAAVAGVAEPGAQVSVAVDDATPGSPATGSAVAHPTTGAFSVPVDVTALADGPVVATATATDAAGNTGDAGESAPSVLDTVAPDRPRAELTTPVAANRQTTVSGEAEKGAALAISVDDADPATAPVTSTATADGTTGAYSVPLTLTGLADGVVTASVVATDAAGNASEAGTATATLDTAGPARPTLSMPTVNDANQAAVAATGMTDPGSAVTVTVSDGTATLTREVTADADSGAYTAAFTAVGDLADGTLAVTATARDAAGNDSAARAIDVVKDTAAPAATDPVLPMWVNRAGRSAVEIGGTAEKGATVTVTLADEDLTTADVATSAVAGPTGSWTATADLTTLADGVVTATAVVTDTAGNPSESRSATTTKDVAAPAAPGVVLPAVGQANAAATEVSGTAEDGSAVAVSVDDTDAATAAVTGTGTATGGSYAVPLDLTSLTDGSVTATATATDAAGNVSAPGTSPAATKDTVTLARVTTLPADGSLVRPPSAVTVTFNEAVAPGATLTLADRTDALLAGTTTLADGGRTVVFTPDGPLGNAGSPYTAAFAATDANDPETADGTFTFRVDGIAPDQPELTVPAVVTAATYRAVPVSGSAEPGSSVRLTIDDEPAGAPAVRTVTAGTDGAYAATFDLAGFADGPLTATAVATDAAGNASATRTRSATLDATAPGEPTVELPEFVNAANKAAVPVSGVADAGSDVVVSVDDATAGSPVTKALVADATTGAYSTTLDLTALAEGPLAASATAADAAGNVTASRTRAATKDTVAPALSSADLTDPVNAAATTSASVSGIADPGSSVLVSVDDATAGDAVTKTATAHATSGAYAVSLDVTPLADGTLTASVTATDAAANSSPTLTDTATKDAQVPPAPSLSLPSVVNAANQAAVTASGKAEPGTSVLVSVDDATAGSPVTRTAVPDATSGAYSVSFDLTTLADGPLSATAVSTDGAGNSSAAGPAAATKDAAVPGAPTLDLPAVVNAANTAAVPVSGVAEAGAAVVVSVDDAVAGSPVTKALTAHATTGAYSTTLDLTALADGPLAASARATDAAGNVSPAGTRTATKDARVPGRPEVSVPAFVNAAGQAAMAVTGTADPGTSVVVSVDDATAGSPVTRTATADATSGAYAVSADVTSLADGALTTSVTAADAAGNVSPAATAPSTKDVAAPAAPGLSVPAYANAANAAAYPVSGVADPGTSVLVSVDDATAGSPVSKTVTAHATSGAYAVSLDLTPLADGPLTAAATATDAAGNASPTTPATAAKDVEVPARPTVEAAEPVNAAGKTTTTVAGVAERGATVTVAMDDTTAGDAVTKVLTADAASGAYSVSLDVTGLADGTLTAAVTAADAAGNVSPAGTDTAVKDSRIPDVPELHVPAEVTRATRGAAPFAGSAEPGATVALSVDDSDVTTLAVTGTTLADAEGRWATALDVSSLEDGLLTVAVTATDAATNTSGTTSGSVTKNVTRAFTIAAGGNPVSGAAQAVTVTAHATYRPDSAVDTSFTGTPVLSSLDGHFTAGSCAAAVDGVASCTGTVFGDLGPQSLVATSGSGDDYVAGSAPVVVRPTGLVYSVAPASRVAPGQPVTFTVAPAAGVAGASLDGYTAQRMLSVTGGGTPPTGTVLTCAQPACEGSVTFPTHGVKTVKVYDNGTPALSTPTAVVYVPYGTALSLVRSRSVVPAGGSVKLSGKLTNTAVQVGVAGQPVELYRRTAPGTTYRYFATVVTASDGTWSRQVALTRNTAYQARFAGDSLNLPSASVARTVLAAPVVSSAWSVSGRTVKAVGKVSPNAAGQTAYLQYRKADGTWAYASAKALVTSVSGYTVSRAFAPGTYVLRVAIRATTLNTAGYSRTFAVTVR